MAACGGEKEERTQTGTGKIRLAELQFLTAEMNQLGDLVAVNSDHHNVH